MGHIEELKDGIDKFAAIIKSYKTIPNVEIELRIGILEGGVFRPGLVSENFFYKIKNFLDSNPNWNSTQEIITEESLNNGIVKINNDKTKKLKIYNANFSYENTPYDFRISVSSEEKTQEKFKPGGITRQKTRYSYIHKSFRYDLTKVVQITNGVSENIFEFEIELLDLNSNMSDVYRAHSALLKIRDVINHCEKINEPSKVNFISDNIILNFDGIKIS